MTFGLLLSDYMSRHVLNAVFPSLQMEWGLSDAQMGALSGIVALTVGLLTIPLSLLADRWGRVRSLTLMATLWSVATLGCAVSTSFGEMLAARLVVGVGEAAYGSVGTAVVLSVFPRRQRASLSGALMAGGAFGAVLGMALGGYVAARMGWRWSFGVTALFGRVRRAPRPGDVLSVPGDVLALAGRQARPDLDDRGPARRALRRGPVTSDESARRSPDAWRRRAVSP
ncbi:MFS transporter [Sorangium sp. So ce341]